MRREAIGKYLEGYSDLTSILKGNCSCCIENSLGVDVGMGKQGLNYWIHLDRNEVNWMRIVVGEVVWKSQILVIYLENTANKICW